MHSLGWVPTFWGLALVVHTLGAHTLGAHTLGAHTLRAHTLLAGRFVGFQNFLRTTAFLMRKGAPHRPKHRPKQNKRS